MEAAEYSNLEKVERDHWYYCGKRELVRWWLKRFKILQPATVLIDCGAGTGRFAQELASECDVRVVDDHGESLEILRRKFPPDKVFEGSCTHLPFQAGSVDCITALDVLEHVQDDALAVSEFYRVVRNGGSVVITVPARMELWSDWDVALHHFRRYHRRDLLALFPGKDWEVLHVNYTNVVVFPVVWLIRKWRRWTGAAKSRAEDALPVSWLNRALKFVFVRTGQMSAVPFPFGVSLLLVARKRSG